MPKKIRCFLKGVEVTDEDSVGVFLDFDGIQDPEKIAAQVETRKKIGEQVTVWDVLLVLFLIWKANKEVE